MKPRVFESSSYYDLKHVRERFESFIGNYGFEPVLFESGQVAFERGKNIDISCYNEVKLCNLMILIIGARFGTLISKEFTKDSKLSYQQEHISFTRKEFEAAR